MEAADCDLAWNVMGIPLAMGARGDFLIGVTIKKLTFFDSDSIIIMLSRCYRLPPLCILGKKGTNFLCKIASYLFRASGV